MNSTFAVLARIFPVLVVAGSLALAALVVRVWSRMSSGSVTAGPPTVPPAPTTGLESVPWTARSIAHALDARPEAVRDRLLQRAGDAGIDVVIPAAVPVPHQIRDALEQLESALLLHRAETDPITGATPTPQEGS